MHAHIAGGGISGLAAAAYLVRDAGLLAANIHVHEASSTLGGALDASGSATTGYTMRGGRMFEDRESCLFDLFSFVPTRDDPTLSLKDDLTAFNALHGWHNKARLVADGDVLPSDDFGLSTRNLLDLAELLLMPEALLGGKAIGDVLDPSIMDTAFWYMFGSIFAFLPWHSAIEMRRYLLRFFHLLPTMSSMTTIRRTRYNQHEAVVEPLRLWLERLGVVFHFGHAVTDIDFEAEDGRLRPAVLHLREAGMDRRLNLGLDDVVFATLGSHVACSTTGGMEHAPPPPSGTDPAWALWERLANDRPAFGRPEIFHGDVDTTGWVTFTVTARGGPLPDLVRALSGSELGRGGLMTLTRSPWLLTVTAFHNPHFRAQPEDVDLFWGYGLYLDRPGTVARKPMAACSGREILTETAHHLGFSEHLGQILETCNCIPTLLPLAGSVLMRRQSVDRPKVIPAGYDNLALLGQFVEVPEDVVFTTEYAVRGARMAVAGLFDEARPVPPVYKGQYDPHTLAEALRVLRR